MAGRLSPLQPVVRPRRVPWWKRDVTIPLWFLVLILTVGTFEWLSAVGWI